MKVGDLIRLKCLSDDWGLFGLVTRVNVTEIGLGQISLIAGGNCRTLPWIKRKYYISEVISGDSGKSDCVEDDINPSNFSNDADNVSGFE